DPFSPCLCFFLFLPSRLYFPSFSLPPSLSLSFPPLFLSPSLYLSLLPSPLSLPLSLSLSLSLSVIPAVLLLSLITPRGYQVIGALAGCFNQLEPSVLHQ